VCKATGVGKRKALKWLTPIVCPMITIARINNKERETVLGVVKDYRLI
jgi:hypothetical protein